MTWWNWRRRRNGRKPGEMNFSDNSQITAGPRYLRYPFHSMRCGHPLQIPHVCILNWRHDGDMSYMPVVYMEAFRWNRKSSCKLSIWEPPTGSHRMLNASKCYFLDSLISCKSNYTSILIKLLLEQLRICVRLIILCWRECHKGICDHTKAFPTTSAWLSTSRKSKAHFQIIQILSSLGFSFSCSPSFTKSLVVVMSNTSMKSSIRHLWSNESIMSPWLWWSSRLSSMPLSNCWCTCSRTVHGKSCACSLLRMSWPQSFEIGILVEVLSVNSWGKPLLNI